MIKAAALDDNMSKVPALGNDVNKDDQDAPYLDALDAPGSPTTTTTLTGVTLYSDYWVCTY